MEKALRALHKSNYSTLATLYGKVKLFVDDAKNNNTNTSDERKMHSTSKSSVFYDFHTLLSKFM